MWRLVSTEGKAPRGARLFRRGIDHGTLKELADPATTEAAGDTDDLAAAWRRAEPILLPGILSPALPHVADWIEHSRGVFAHLRDGGRFLDVVEAMLQDEPSLRLEGSTVDSLEPREIEKVFVSGLADGKRTRDGRDVWAKLAWVAHDDADLSLRVRCSCGTEQLEDWHQSVGGQVWSDRLATALFPEGAAITEHGELQDVVASLLGGNARYSERIIYSNAPGGGAVFHHDADPTQRGVLYAQMFGATAWLALPKSALLEQIVTFATAQGDPELPKTAAEAATRLEQADDTPLYRLLNETPEFSRQLADAGWLSVLRAGDALLLPSHSIDQVAWHSVFALGDEPSLSHSYGLFPAA